MATYVEKEGTQIASALSLPISLLSCGLGGASPGGNAASLSDRAILCLAEAPSCPHTPVPISSSPALQVSGLCCLLIFTSFAGIRTMLFATLNGVGFGF